MTTTSPGPETVPVVIPVESIEARRDFVFTTRKVTPEDTELWLKMGMLRGSVYLDRQYVDVSDLDENGAEYDTYDETADHFVAVDDEENVIGTVRVIQRENELSSLPSEHEFGTLLPLETQEVSRLIRDPDLSPQDGLLVSLAMMRAALKATVGRSERVYAVLEQKLHRQLSYHIGIQLINIAEPRKIPHYNDTLNYLVEMEPRYITSQIHARDERVYEETQRHAALAESIMGKPFAPFFERHTRTQGLGRVSLADLTEPNPDQFDRNGGFYSPEEQRKIWDSTVSIAGAGGDGGEIALTLANAGVRKFRIADPESFSVENLNRQAGADYSTIGHNKAKVLAKKLRALGAEVTVYEEGINQDNITEFIQGSDLVLDETEFTMPELGVMIAREARANKLPVLMSLNVGFGSYTNSFDPEGMTFEEYLGIDPNMSIEEIAAYGASNPISIDRWAPHIPSYANVNILGRL